MSCHELRVRGLVLDSRQHEPVPGLRVELWAERSADAEDVLFGASETLDQGAFSIVYAERSPDDAMTGFRLLLREPDGTEIQDVDGPTEWTADDPPGQIVLYAQVDQGLHRRCPKPPTLRRAYHQIQNYPSDTSGTLRVGVDVESDKIYKGAVGRIVGTVRSATGAGLPNLRLRLTARPIGRSFAAPTLGGGYDDPTREFELARTYTHGTSTPEDTGTYEILWPLELPATSEWRGQGWWDSGSAAHGWDVGELEPPYLLILRVEAPVVAGVIDLTAGPSWSQPYTEVAATQIAVRTPGEPALAVQDFLLDALNLPEDTEFARMSSALDSFEHALFGGVGSGFEGAINQHFDAADLLVLAEGVHRAPHLVASWLLAHKLSYELAGAANRSKNVLTSATTLSVHQAILSPELCYGILRSSGRVATAAVLALPLSEVRDHLCLAMSRRQIASRTQTQIDEVLHLLLHAGLVPSSVTRPRPRSPAARSARTAFSPCWPRAPRHRPHRRWEPAPVAKPGFWPCIELRSSSSSCGAGSSPASRSQMASSGLPIPSRPRMTQGRL